MGDVTFDILGNVALTFSNTPNVANYESDGDSDISESESIKSSKTAKDKTKEVSSDSESEDSTDSKK